MYPKTKRSTFLIRISLLILILLGSLLWIAPLVSVPTVSNNPVSEPQPLSNEVVPGRGGTTDWEAYDWEGWNQFGAIHTEGELTSITEGNSLTSFDVVWEEAVGNVWGPKFQVFLRPVEQTPQPVNYVKVTLHIGDAPVTEADLQLSLGNSSIELAKNAVLHDGQEFVWVNPSPSSAGLSKVIVQLDALRYFDNGAVDNPIGFAEIEIGDEAILPSNLTASVKDHRNEN